MRQGGKEKAAKSESDGSETNGKRRVDVDFGIVFNQKGAQDVEDGVDSHNGGGLN